MRFLIQRVKEASVEVIETAGAAGEQHTITGQIGRGFMVLIGVCDKDTEAIADKLIDKMCKLRIFEDAQGKTNLNLDAVNGGLLLVSQFTLYADTKKGNRPSFLRAGSPAHAEALYNYIVDKCRERVPVVQTGVFGALMDVHLVNDGPFTVLLDSEEYGL